RRRGRRRRRDAGTVALGGSLRRALTKTCSNRVLFLQSLAAFRPRRHSATYPPAYVAHPSVHHGSAVRPGGGMPGTSAPTTISVPFSGEGSGIGELTWGQREILRAVRLSGRSIVLGGVTPLPESWTVDDVVLRVQFLMRRHQSLRTRLVRDARGGVKQVVSAAGELIVELYDAVEDEDVKALTDAVNEHCA